MSIPSKYAGIETTREPREDAREVDDMRYTNIYRTLAYYNSRCKGKVLKLKLKSLKESSLKGLSLHRFRGCGHWSDF